jgi:hypothetical protein
MRGSAAPPVEHRLVSARDAVVNQIASNSKTDWGLPLTNLWKSV